MTYTFDTDLQGWAINYAEPEALMTGSTLVHDGAAGAMTLTIPFSAPSDRVEVAVNLDVAVSLGGPVTAEVTLVSGLTEDTMNPGGALMFAKSSENYIYAGGAWTNLEVGVTTTITLDPAAPDYVDTTGAVPFSAADIRQIGFQIAASGTEDTMPTEAVLQIDNISY
jgi:hypothetical protein